jgi:hypothetical protein
LGAPDQYDFVDNGRVNIYEKISGQWVYQGSTTTSSCGYYTYVTGHRGEFKVDITASNQTIRENENGCISATYTESSLTGWNSGTIYIWQTWKVIDVFSD